MPGISFICDLKGDLRRASPLIAAALRPLMHDERYELHEWLNDDVHYLGYTAYKEYPIDSFEFGNVTVYLEGRFYGKNSDDNTRALRELTDLAFTCGDKLQASVIEWLNKTDGDFVALLYHKETGEIVIINDIFGRLPLYYWEAPHRLILTRELRFIADLMDLKRFDRMALAQHLLIGFPLGERTLLENVHRLPPATCITIRKARSRIQIDHLYRFNYEVKTDERRTVKDSAAELVSLFSRSSAARALSDANTVVSLSGGFDSRAIAACCHKAGIPFRCATFLDPNGRAEADVAIARQVANLFDAEWKLVSLNAPLASEILKLLRMKNGMNPLYMSFILGFLDEIRTSWGSDLVYMSGELGHGLLRDLRPADKLASLEELTDHLIGHEPKFSLETVSSLTGLTPTEILAELRQHVLLYPEQDWEQKFIHFYFYEHAFKWCSEGEDRNRCYFWNATPYSGIEFFNFVMRCPDEQKSYYGLLGEFLLQLSPAAAAIEHTGTGAAITSNRFNLKRKALAFLQGDPDLRRRLEAVMGPRKGYDPEPLTIRWLRQQMPCDAIFEYLSAPALRNVVYHYTNYTKESIDLLFTITATIEERLTGKSVLDERDRIAGASDGR